MDRFQRQTEIMTRLFSEILYCIPEEWTKGQLIIDCTDGKFITYKLKNEAEPGTASISEDLRNLIDEMYLFDMSSGQRWAQAVMSFRKDQEGFSFNTSYSYPPVVPRAKPFWKFW